MTDKELKAWKQFFDTEHAVLTAFLNLIQDLVPVIGLDESQRLVNIIKEAQHKPYKDEESNFTSVSTGYATYTAEDIRTCFYCKHNAGLSSNNGTVEYSGACKNCIAKDKWEKGGVG